MPVPGPPALGRGVVVDRGGATAVPEPWRDAPVVVLDDAALAAPAGAVERLHRVWARREPVVVELAVDPARFREPAAVDAEPWTLDPHAEPWFDRLHFLVWANNYDVRSGVPVWWWARKAARLGATEVPTGPADVRLPDGTDAWVDGGPRRPFGAAEVAEAVVHHETVELGRLAPAPGRAAPTSVLASGPASGPASGAAPAPGKGQAGLAPDQLAAVSHLSGPARVIAPAGSGKTRVLTERLRHLLGERAWETEAVVAVAYNKEAQLELERRTSAFRPQVRTLNALGRWVLAEHRGRAPDLLEERECRRLVESLLPGRRPRRANTDPIGPYLEALGAVRLGLVVPDVVEASRDDVDGLAGLFAPYRAALAERGAVDFDDQVYAALEALLADGPFRRRMQSRCRHLLVDELQDLTPAHVLLMRLLALPALDVFGVGDDDQTIYGHAGADPAFLIDYASLFPEAGEHALTVNYRCPVAVVDGARRLLGYNDRRVAKEIHAGPGADPAPDALRVVEHDPQAAASAAVEVVRGWLAEREVPPGAVAVLARVHSALLAPQVALAEAGVAVRSALRRDVLERTGLRASLAYLRIATAGDAIDPADVVEVLRRPTRGLPPWFADRLSRRRAWSVAGLEALAGDLPGKEGAKVLRLAGDLAEVAAAARAGTTRRVLEVVRDDVGLGAAMGLLDGTGAAQGSSHLDDLEGLLAVADLHPDPAGFEAWLRGVLARDADPEGVVLSTVHRVKGREWDRVLVVGVVDGLLPHRLSPDVEEERRVLHVAITRARHRAVVLTDRSRRSPFLAELDGTAPRRPARRPAGSVAEPDATGGVRRPRGGPEGAGHGSGRGAERGGGRRRAPEGDVISAGAGLVLRSGGYEGTVEDADGRGVRLRLDGGTLVSVRYGERVEHAGRRAPLAAPTELWGVPAAAEAALRAWRSQRSKADGVPAYVVLNDAHLRGIALARPSTAADLVACPGIGPTKLDRYGDDILATLDALPDA